MTVPMPARKPARPFFSSGPCAKPPTWSPDKLATQSLGRSHRAKIGKTRLQLCIDLMREVLQLPDSHRIGIVPGSDTGAFEMAMWTMLGARPVTTLAWESFGAGWVTDVVKQLKLDAEVCTADYGQIADLAAIDPESDVVFTWNGTTRAWRAASQSRLISARSIGMRASGSSRSTMNPFSATIRPSTICGLPSGPISARMRPDNGRSGS